MLKIKLLTENISKLAWTRLLPTGSHVLNNCQIIFDEQCEDYDYLVVYGELTKNIVLKNKKQRTIFITSEPKNVKIYNEDFLQQFDYLITYHDSYKHKNIIINHAVLPWHFGVNFDLPYSTDSVTSFDAIANIPLPKKNKLLSVICSDKKYTKEHRQRLKFVEQLPQFLKHDIDIFGRGFKPIPDKKDAILPYKYHLSLENCSFNHYWTEKISDAFLGYSLPIYWGCPNLENYFPASSFVRIDINNPKAASEIIDGIIDDNYYDKCKMFLAEARHKVLYDYNIFSMVARIVVDIHGQNVIFSNITEVKKLNSEDSFISKKQYIIKKTKEILYKFMPTKLICFLKNNIFRN